MSEAKIQTTSGGGLSGLLALLFIGLKLTGHIDWPWLWVLAPLWVPWLLVLVIVVAAVLLGIVKAALEGKK